MEGFIAKEYMDTNGLNMYEMLKDVDVDGKVIENKVMKELIHQAYKAELIKKLRQRIGYAIDQYLDSEEFLKNNPVFKAEMERQEKFNTRYIFLTVSPEPSITLKTVIDIVKKAVSKKWMNNYLYVIEQRGSVMEDCGKLPHIHMIIDTDIDKKRHEIIRELKNTFKKLCDTSHTAVFNVKNIKDEHLKNFVKYIAGKKKDEIKHPKQIIDREFRKKNNIQPIYGAGELLEFYDNNMETVDEFDYNF